MLPLIAREVVTDLGGKGLNQAVAAQRAGADVRLPRRADFEPLSIPSVLPHLILIAVERGTSYDVHELDAASNNGVDAMRDLISRAAVGSPGRITR